MDFRILPYLQNSRIHFADIQNSTPLEPSCSIKRCLLNNGVLPPELGHKQAGILDVIHRNTATTKELWNRCFSHTLYIIYIHVIWSSKTRGSKCLASVAFPNPRANLVKSSRPCSNHRCLYLYVFKKYFLAELADLQSPYLQNVSKWSKANIEAQMAIHWYECMSITYGNTPPRLFLNQQLLSQGTFHAVHKERLTCVCQRTANRSHLGLRSSFPPQIFDEGGGSLAGLPPVCHLRLGRFHEENISPCSCKCTGTS